MTLLVVLCLGFGSVLLISAIETDPQSGRSVPVLRTIQQIWNDELDFSSTPGEKATPKLLPHGPSYQAASLQATAQQFQR